MGEAKTEREQDRELVRRVVSRLYPLAKERTLLPGRPVRFEVSPDVLRETAEACAAAKYPRPHTSEAYGSLKLAVVLARQAHEADTMREPLVDLIVRGVEPLSMFGIPVVVDGSLPPGTAELREVR